MLIINFLFLVFVEFKTLQSLNIIIFLMSIEFCER